MKLIYTTAVYIYIYSIYNILWTQFEYGATGRTDKSDIEFRREIGPRGVPNLDSLPYIYIYMCSCFMLLFAVLMFCSVHERDALHRGVKNPVPGGS